MKDTSYWFDAHGEPTQTEEHLAETYDEELPYCDDRLREPFLHIYRSKRGPVAFNLFIPVLVAENKHGLSKAQQNVAIDKLKNLAEKQGAEGFFMTRVTQCRYSARRVESVNTPLLTLTRKEGGFLNVISGGSGSGKTWLMLHDKTAEEIAIYLTSEELGVPGEFKESDFEPNTRWNEDRWSQATSTGDRNTCAKSVLFSAITRCVSKEILLLIKEAKDHPILIVIDEIGGIPTFLRALCAIHATLAAELRDYLQITNRCTFLVGGTGAGATNTFTEEDLFVQSSFMLHPMPNNTKVWKAVLEKGKQLARHPGARTFAGALDRNSTVRQLVTNPRVAALVFQKFVSSDDEFWGVLGENPSERAMKCVLPEFLARVARQFRLLNAMATVSEQAMWQTYRSALALVMFPGFDRQYPIMLNMLLIRYGVLVDQIYSATEPRSEGHVPLAHQQRNSPPALWLPKQRYIMPPAQLQLFRLGYGFQIGEAAVTPGDGFEFTVSQFLEVLLLAANEIASLEQVLVKLGLDTTKNGAVPEEWKQPLNYKGVEVVQSEIKVEDGNLGQLKSSGHWNKTIKKFIDEGKAVVMINYPKAAFADLVVFIPKRAVLLVQAKFYLESTPLAELDVLQELDKMGYSRNETVVQAKQQGDGLSFLLRALADTKNSLLYSFITTKSGDLGLPPDVLCLFASEETLSPIMMPHEEGTPLLPPGALLEPAAVRELNFTPVERLIIERSKKTIIGWGAFCKFTPSFPPHPPTTTTTTATKKKTM